MGTMLERLMKLRPLSKRFNIYNHFSSDLNLNSTWFVI
jgi:hypothetical protein